MSYPEGLHGVSAQIAKLIAAMDEDDDIRVIVIRGVHGLYSSGGDIAGFLKVARDGSPDFRKAHARSRYESPSSANAAL
jgi:enoyl-CoA hydratase/carnithine racemase